MEKQVKSSHYEFGRYMHKLRWVSLWYQLDEVIKLSPARVLEIGPGPGTFKAVAASFGMRVETLDIDPSLRPDYLASVMALPFADNSFDVVCAFQMLEHLPFEKSLTAFREMVRVARNAVVISVPDAERRWPVSFFLPFFGQVNFSVLRPRLFNRNHIFDGEHYWEISTSGFKLETVINAFETAGEGRVILCRRFRVPEHPYHHFFVYRSRC